VVGSGGARTETIATGSQPSNTSDISKTSCMFSGHIGKSNFLTKP
jgi:hypothetical protein